MKIKITSRTIFIFLTLSLSLWGCATPNKNIALGGLIGGAAGAVAGDQLTRTEAHRSRNTVVTSLAIGLITAGALAWHYREMEQQLVEVSGRYSRYRLCDAGDFNQQVAPHNSGQGCREEIYQIPASQIDSTAITLDEETKWVHPTFRKRQLPAERGDNHVISRRYIWEVIRPGTFITKEQKPD